jgi:hypothetical protein
MTLQEVLSWIISGGGAGILGWWLVNNVPSLKALPNYGWKRVVALSLSALLAMGMFGLSVGMTYSGNPGTFRGWVEVLFNVGAAAAGISQIIHGFTASK